MAPGQDPDDHLGPDEPVGEGLRRIACEQIALAQRQLAAPRPDEIGVAVHESRKAFKRVRAVVRLARDELGDEIYRLENRSFRDAGRRISGVRDATVLVETLDLVGDGAFGGLRTKLVEELDLEHERLRSSSAFAEVLEALAAAEARVGVWPLPEDGGHDVLAPGFARIYRRGRRALRAARDEPGDESLHELRKRAKDLWHAAQIARPAAPNKLKRLARRAHDLSDLTGEDHDLAVLAALARQRTGVMEPGEPALLEAVIERRRARLQRDALECASDVYARKPRKLAGVVAG
jgi:CHAD domain-containing protein